ncbi:hypothetical protein BGX30_007211, partial [Mortierella sp. GBA39]
MLSEIYNYGTSYRGPDCTIDLETQSKIEGWFMDAADQGVAHAQICMADMYAKGLGVVKDESKAFEWLLKAAEQGNEDSQRRVAYSPHLTPRARKQAKQGEKSMRPQEAVQEHVQGFRSVHESHPPSTTTVPLNSPKVVHIDCYTDPDTNRDFILWEDIQQAFSKALSVRNRTKVLPFAKGKDLRALEPRRIAAVPDVVLDIVVGGELAAADVASMERIVQDLSLNTPPQSSSSSARRNPTYGDELEAMQNYNHMDVPASISHRRGPQTVHGEHKDDSSNAPAEKGQQPEANTKNLLNPQDYDAAADMGLMQTMINANYGDAQAQVALGDRYKYGREVHRDHQAAMDWYIKAADQDHPRARFNIGLLYDQGHDGVPQDDIKAFEWFH